MTDPFVIFTISLYLDLLRQASVNCSHHRITQKWRQKERQSGREFDQGEDAREGRGTTLMAVGVLRGALLVQSYLVHAD